MPSPHYRYVVIQTYRAVAEASPHSIRARVLPGQDLPETMRVECSSKMRESHPVGTRFKIKAKIKQTSNDPHLYTSYQWEYETMSAAKATAFIRAKIWY
jgi:hypothetical protein